MRSANLRLRGEVELPFQGILEGLNILRQRGAAFCFIDTAPSRTDETAALFQLADLVLVPIRQVPQISGRLGYRGPTQT